MHPPKTPDSAQDANRLARVEDGKKTEGRQMEDA